MAAEYIIFEAIKRAVIGVISSRLQLHTLDFLSRKKLEGKLDSAIAEVVIPLRRYFEIERIEAYNWKFFARSARGNFKI
jgi:hypothetical protein